MSVQQEIYDFVRSLQPDKSFDFDVDLDLLESGILDSVAVMELVVWSEDHFQIGIDPDDLVPENFQTLKSIAEFIGKSSKAE